MAEILDAFDTAKQDLTSKQEYEANPQDAFARAKRAQVKGVNLDTEAPVGQPGFLGGAADVGRGLAKGVISTLPEQLGKAAEFFGAPETGKQLRQFGEEQDKAHPEFRQSQVGQIAAADDLSVRGGAYGAGENTPLSHGPALAAAGIGAGIGAVGGPAGALAGAGIGYVVGSLAALPVFYGSQAQETKENIKKGLLNKGASEAEAESQSNIGGHLSGAVEAGGELVADLIPFHALFNPLAKAVKGQLVKSTLGNVGKKIAATTAGVVTAEVSTEMAQQALEDQIEKEYGGEGPGATWKSTLSVVVPTALMTLIPGGFTAAHNFRSNMQVRGALANPEADPEQRAAAASMVFHSIKGQDPMAAHAFDVYAANAIGRSQPIELKDDAGYKADLLNWLQNPGESIVNPFPGALQPGAAAQTTAQQFGIDETAGPVSAAAATALNTGASGEAQAGREEEGQAATGGAVDLTQSLPLEEATAKRDELQAQTGEEHELVPDPTNHEQYLLKPTGRPAPPSEEAAADAEKQAKEAEKAVEQERKAAATDLSRRMKDFGAEAKAVETKAKAKSGEGEPQLPAVFKALVVASSAHWDATAAARALKTAIEEDRGDIAHALVERAYSEWEKASQAKTVVPTDSPFRKAAEAALTKKTEQRWRSYQTMLRLNEVADNAVTPGLGGEVPPRTTKGASDGPVPQPLPPVAPQGGEPGPTETPGPVGPGQDKPGDTTDVPGPEAPTGQGGEGPVTQPQPPGGAKNGEPGGETTAGPGVGGPAPTPTGPQIDAGNYKKEHVTVAGFPVAFESKEGMTRKSKPGVEPAWESVIQKAHYGYIKKTEGADEEEVDTFVKPDTAPDHVGPVFVIDQSTKDGGFDEHKIMLGYNSQIEAIGAYKANYPAGHKVGPVTQTTNEEVKKWLKEGDTTKPFADRAADPLDTLVDYDKLEETDDNLQPTGRYAEGKVPARDALKDIDERISFARAMRECLGI